jgi:hypothetical protein
METKIEASGVPSSRSRREGRGGLQMKSTARFWLIALLAALPDLLDCGGDDATTSPRNRMDTTGSSTGAQGQSSATGSYATGSGGTTTGSSASGVGPTGPSSTTSGASSTSGSGGNGGSGGTGSSGGGAAGAATGGNGPRDGGQAGTSTGTGGRVLDAGNCPLMAPIQLNTIGCPTLGQVCPYPDLHLRCECTHTKVRPSDASISSGGVVWKCCMDTAPSPCPNF